MKTLLLALCLTTLSAQAGPSKRWDYLRGLGMADIVEDGATIMSSAGVSFPGGVQAVVTYLQSKDMLFQCRDYYDDSTQHTAQSCFVAVPGKPRPYPERKYEPSRTENFDSLPPFPENLDRPPPLEN